jgi:hypothetical protein
VAADVDSKTRRTRRIAKIKIRLRQSEMTKKTEMQDPETLDSLLERKEQTDTALVELADTLREKLRRVEAVVGRPQTTQAKVSIKKPHVYWGAIFVLQVLLIAYLQVFFASGKSEILVPSPSGLEMMQQEADLVRSAIELVRDDVVEGKLTSTALTLQALSSMLPSSVREAVLNELGTPDMDFMRDALDILEGKLP